MRLIKLAGVVIVISLLAVILPSASSAAPALQGENLLANPGLELPYTDGDKQANGWGRWFEDTGKADEGLDYVLSPDFSRELNSLLIHGGISSQHVGRRFDPWHAGVKQDLTVAAGSQVRFCAYGRIFAANGNFEQEESWSGHNGRLRVGISPNGLTEWTGAITWSAEANPHNLWQQICVDATVGAAGQISVFTSADFRGTTAFHLDVWWDDASLVVIGQQPPADTPPDAPPEATDAAPDAPPPAAAAITCDTREDGTVVRVVQSGDTLSTIALGCDTSVDALRSLNNLTTDILSIGQVIIVEGTAAAAPEPTATSEATEEPASEEPTDAEPAASEEPVIEEPESPVSSEGEVCVEAFNDSNANQVKDADEQLLGGVGFTLSDALGPQSTHVTSGLETSAYCFGGLAPGAYVIEVRTPVGVSSTTDQRWEIGVTAGTTFNVQFGGTRGETAPQPDLTEPDEQPVEEPAASDEPDEGGGGSDLGRFLLGVVGVIILLVAGFVANLVIARARGR